MNEAVSVYLVLGLLVAFIIIGALLPRFFPRLIRTLDASVLKEEKPPGGGHNSH